MKPLRLLSFVLLWALASVCLSAQDSTSGPWVMQTSGSKASFRGIHAVGGGVAWASGTDGTILRTEDSGFVWQSCALPPDAGKLDFRGIWAWDANTAIIMSSGTGNLSRLYKTTDGCSHWTLAYTNPDKDGFWDAVVFWDGNHGILLGDPVEISGEPAPSAGPEFPLLYSADAGKTWNRKFGGNGEDLKAKPAEAGAFAASNSSLTIRYPFAWFGIGGKGGPFVYRGRDRSDHQPELGFAWDRVTVPLSGGSEAAGVFSLAFRDAQHGMAVGGDYQKPNEPSGTAAWTLDGGEHWTAATKPPHGYRSAVAWDADSKAWIAVGPNGSDISYDDGKSWSPLDNGNWNALSLPWVVGPKGRIAKLDEGRLKTGK